MMRDAVDSGGVSSPWTGRPFGAIVGRRAPFAKEV